MPLFESSCISQSCPLAGQVTEWLGKYEDPEPLCTCGTPMTRLVSRFGVIWTGALTSKYVDRSLEGGHGDGGHWAYRTKNTASGKPEPVYIETFQQQREYCKAEGLGLPSDTDFAMISDDGRSTSRVTKSVAMDLKSHTAEQDTRQLAETAQSGVGS